jgi:tRNA(Ile)-lysidine synthase
VTSLIQRVAADLRERCGLARGGPLLVAVSGGVDSMALLHLLNALAPEWGWQLAVAHFNHQLRGRSSDRDEALVCRTAAALQLPVTVGQGNVKAFAQQSGLSPEMAARKLRHEFLARTARAGGISTIALAHHADDQVELFFLRLLRGAGGEGLAGMRWRAPSPMDPAITLVRPLLDVTKAELEAYAHAAGVPFRADATNASHAVPRNRVRHELLPLLRAKYQPGLNRTILRAMEIARAEADLAGDLAAQWLASGARRAKSPAFATLPLAVQRRVIQSQLPKLGLPLDFELVEQLRATAARPVNAGLNLFAVRDTAGRVKLISPAPATVFNPAELEIKLTGRIRQATFAGVTITWERLPAGKITIPPPPQPGREIYDAAKITGPVTLRHWRPGDRFQPLGLPRPLKLQDLFTNAKIPRERRRELLVATTQGEVFWVEGLRMAEQFKLTPKTKWALVWRWKRI